jgi:AbrB family looped-hinge helix DNA binding protein
MFESKAKGGKVKMRDERSPETAKVSKKYQIVIPKGVRRLLGIRPGDRFLISVEGDKVVMRLRPRSYAQKLRGLHKEVWQGVEASEYVEKERETWEKKE